MGFNFPGIIGAGTPELSWIGLERNDFEGQNQKIWTPNVFIKNAKNPAVEGNGAVFIYDSGVVLMV